MPNRTAQVYIATLWSFLSDVTRLYFYIVLLFDIHVRRYSGINTTLILLRYNSRWLG